MTQYLAERAGSVVAVEIDQNLIPILRETLAEYDNVSVINDDILKVDLGKIVEEQNGGRPIKVVANLPYYITTPIILKLLESKIGFKSITVMVQKEAADRLCAEVGSRDGGAVTVAVNYYAESEKLFFVPKESFLPPPKVNSQVIRLTVRKEPPVKAESEEFFFKLVKAAFSQRRKTAENSVSAGLGISKNEVAEALEQAGLERNARAETLTMEDFANLEKLLNK